MTKKKSLKFYDLKNKESFETDDYEIEERGGRRYAITSAPSGAKSWRILGKQN